jgi:hypothetical protein
MQTQQEVEQLMTRYLLGELSAEEKEEFEGQLCLDGELFERMLNHRDGLIDNYLGNSLSTSQRQHFEQHFMASPEQRERVEMAQALLDVFAAEHKINLPIIDQNADRPSATGTQSEPVSWGQRLYNFLRIPRLAFELGVALLILGSIWAFYDSSRLRKQLAQTQAESERKQRELQQDLAKERERADRLDAELKLAQQPRETPSPRPEQAPRQGSDLLAFVLRSDFDRTSRGPQSGGQEKLTLPSDADSIQLQLKLRSDDYRRYRVTIRELSSNSIVLPPKELSARTTKVGKVVVVTLSASSFAGAAKDFFATLDGWTPEGKLEERVDRYSFQVEKK